MLINANDVDKIGVVCSMLFVFRRSFDKLNGTGQNRTGFQLLKATGRDKIGDPAESCLFMSRV